MSYDKFYKDYNSGELGNVIFLHGAENFLIRWATSLIVSQNRDEEGRELDVMNFSDEDVSIDDVISNAMTYSMFADRRLIIVKNFRPLYRKSGTEIDKSIKEKITEFCRTGAETSVTVFTLDSIHEAELTAAGKALAKESSNYEFARLDRKQLENFIGKRIKKAGKYISRREMNYMIDLTGYYLKESEYSLDDLESDLTKLVNASSETEIERNLIEEIMTGEDERFVFDFVDALISGNKARAMEMTVNNIRKDDSSSMRITSLLMGQFEMMYDSLELSKGGKTVSQMAKDVGANEFRFKKAYHAARNFSEEKLASALTELYDIDKKIKTGMIDKNTALELFVAGF